jgi:hypothetical protein
MKRMAERTSKGLTKNDQSEAGLQNTSKSQPKIGDKRENMEARINNVVA